MVWHCISGSGVEDLVETDAQYSAEAKSKTWLDLRHLLHQKYVPLPASAFVKRRDFWCYTLNKRDHKLSRIAEQIRQW